jgi:hypothetical protein
MKTARTLFTLAALAALCFGDAAAAKTPTTPPRPQQTAVAQEQQQAARKFKIYCVEGTVRVESLTEEELREVCKGPICDLARTEFISLSLARRAAKRFGGVGAPCRCVSETP